MMLKIFTFQLYLQNHDPFVSQISRMILFGFVFILYFIFLISFYFIISFYIYI